MLTLESVRARCREDGDCLLWLGTITAKGYPTAKHQGRRVQVRRWLFDATSDRPLRSDQYPCVTCEQKLCLNRDHIVAKTKGGYMKLAAERGAYRLTPDRLRKLEASMRASSNAKLDIHKAREIRRRYAAGESSHKLGSEFNVHHSVVTAIGANRAWREVATSVFNWALAA